ncbi:MAG: hypothetical protein WAV90_14895 [Gordonia amarae]
MSLIVPSTPSSGQSGLQNYLDRFTGDMPHVFTQNDSPDMLAQRLPRPLLSHGQVAAQLLDDIGEWLRSPSGGRLPIEVVPPDNRVQTLNKAVSYLFERLEVTIAEYDRVQLVDVLIAQNEALLHAAKVNATMLRSRLACFGEKSDSAGELVQHRSANSRASRANRFLIEYTAAQPPNGDHSIENLDYYRLLAIADEIIQRATTSDFLNHNLADFEVSILKSGRLGVDMDAPVVRAMNTYAGQAGRRTLKETQEDFPLGNSGEHDIISLLTESDPAMRAEFGFTLTELRDVCSGLLDLGIADQVTRIDRDEAIHTISVSGRIPAEVVISILEHITLTSRSSFLDIKQDAYPWRFGRDMSYIRRPLILEGSNLVFGFRSVQRLPSFWADSILSARLQSRAQSTEMKKYISITRGKITDSFARAVAARIERFGMEPRLSVRKIETRRIVDSAGQDLGDIDILAAHKPSRTILALEAKDFEVARTPAEISYELDKLFKGKPGKKSTAELHLRRVDWLREHLNSVVRGLGEDPRDGNWKVVGIIVTSDPLVTPLMASSPLPVIAFQDLDIDTLPLQSITRKSKSTQRRKKKKR